MTDDVTATVAALQAEGIEVAQPISDQGWGLLTAITLPGGVELGLYQPRHPTAAQPTRTRCIPSGRSHRSPRALATGCSTPTLAESRRRPGYKSYSIEDVAGNASASQANVADRQ
jgi:hypothetical protein